MAPDLLHARYAEDAAITGVVAEMTGSDDTLGKIERVASALADASVKSKPAILRDYVELVAHYLAGQGRGPALAAPLFDMAAALEDGNPHETARDERRDGLRDASDEMLGRVSASVDVLISAGYSLDHACQIVTRQMIARGVRPPQGGDARAWRNVQAWRHKLLGGRRDTLEFRQYAAFKDKLLAEHGSGVAAIVSNTAVWDRRRS